MGRVTDRSSYEPDDDEVPAHRLHGDVALAYFQVLTGHGNAEPRNYVPLNENGGEQCWWLDPVDAMALGEELVRWGAHCERLNAREAGNEGDPLSPFDPADAE